MKLFTIGDSVSQGFMSGAAARTDLCYSTIIANVLGEKKYNYPVWKKGGLPLNIEEIFRRLEKRLGTDISGIIEWPIAFDLINKYLDEVEDFYEKGSGNLETSIEEKPFNNVSVRGFDVSNSWQLRPSLCKDILRKSEKNGDGFFGMVNDSLQRTAYRVLGSGALEKNFSQLDWLEHHTNNGGVENLIIWLGANNALGTITKLKIKQTSNDGCLFKDGADKVSYETRLKEDWNLWHPEDFRMEYQYMMDQVIEILKDKPNDCKVFVATIPLVTICPLIKAVGEQIDRDNIKVMEWPVDFENPAPKNISELKKGQEVEYSYGKYYPYFPFADDFNINDPHLNRSDVVHIDNCIRKYNRIIQEIVCQANAKLNGDKFYLVDISQALSGMAVKRNNFNPSYIYPEYFQYIHPKVDTKYYGTTRNRDIKCGGIFSLDGVHPTAIGQGLIAYEFLKVMKIAGSFEGNPEEDINWNQIFENDELYQKPIGLLSEIYDNINFKKWLIQKIIE
jgi:hypothetical protein